MKRLRGFASAACLLLAPLLPDCLAAPAPEPEKPQERAVLRAHKYNVRSLAFSPDGKILASCGDADGIIRLWDVASGKNTAALEGHTQGIDKRDTRKFIYQVSFSPDGKTLASCGYDMTVRIWDLATSQNTTTFRDQCPVGQVAFSPRGKTLFAEGAALRLWDLDGTQRRTILSDWKAGHPVIWFSPQDRLFAAGVLDSDPLGRTFGVYDGDTGKNLGTFRGHTGAISAIVFSPDGKSLASTGWDHTVRLWDIATGKETAIWSDQPGRTCCLDFSPDGKLLASGYKWRGDADNSPNGGAVRLYETATGKVLATLKGEPGPIGPLVFSPDGRLLATGSFDGSITVWKLPTVWKPDK